MTNEIEKEIKILEDHPSLKTVILTGNKKLDTQKLISKNIEILI